MPATALGPAVGFDLFQLHVHTVTACLFRYQQNHSRRFNWGTLPLCRGMDISKIWQKSTDL